MNAPQNALAAEGIIVQRDHEEGVTTIVIAARRGMLSWDDVLRGLADANGLDSGPLTHRFDVERSDLESPRTRLSIRALSAVIPDVSLRAIEHPTMDEHALWVELQRNDARAKIRRLKAQIRERFGREPDYYGLQFYEQWDQQPADRALVVLIHGYSAGPDALSGIRSILVQEGWPCASFVYPNDGPLIEAGEMLAEDLQTFRQKFPTRDVVVVAHSMGGLVARVAVEYPESDPGNVKQLIMVCTPNHGTQWAELPGGLECWEQLHTAFKRERLNAFSRSLSDGLNEARADLKPGSKFLRELNARPRNVSVEYSLILGTSAPLNSQQMDRLRDHADQCLTRSRAGRVFLPKVNDLLADFDELQVGRGDGVVAVQRGRLEGVDDTVLLAVTHWAITGRSLDQIPAELKELILARLSGKHRLTCHTIRNQTRGSPH